jgi:GT2 family glycosyltransferase
MIQHLIPADSGQGDEAASRQDVAGEAPAPAVAVLVVNWNRRALLEACLRSLERPQGAEFEVIVVDNGSTDGSLAFLEEYASRAPYPVRLVRNRENRGFCAANNQAIRAARSPFVALLNNDAEAEPGWIGALLEAFGEERVGMAASKILVWEDPTVIDKVGHLIWLDGQNRGRGTGETDRGQYDQIEEVLWPDGCACMYRRQMLEEIGGFDEDLFAYGDDAELGLRARIAGWGCLFMPKAVVRHHRGSTMGLKSPERLFLIERNRVLLAVKLFPGSLLWQNAGYYLARLGAGALAALTNRGEIRHFSTPLDKVRAAWAMVRADWAALRMTPAAWRKRKEVERWRRLPSREVANLLRRHQIRLRDLALNSTDRSRTGR